MESAEDIYRRFRSLGGSERIATPRNIEALARLCLAEKPTRVLELGGGLGTLSYTVLRNSSALLDVYEDDAFCRERLAENLKEFAGRFTIIPTYRLLPPASRYDLMVVDGGHHEPYHPERLYVLALEDLKTVFVEGARRSQLVRIEQALRTRYRFGVMKVPGGVLDGRYRHGSSIVRAMPSRSAALRALSYLHARFVEEHRAARLWRFLKRLATP